MGILAKRAPRRRYPPPLVDGSAPSAPPGVPGCLASSVRSGARCTATFAALHGYRQRSQLRSQAHFFALDSVPTARPSWGSRRALWLDSPSPAARRSLEFCCLEQGASRCRIRLPANDYLQLNIIALLTRPVGRPSHKPVVRFKSFRIQAASWERVRRVVAKVEVH